MSTLLKICYYIGFTIGITAVPTLIITAVILISLKFNKNNKDAKK